MSIWGDNCLDLSLGSPTTLLPTTPVVLSVSHVWNLYCPCLTSGFVVFLQLRVEESDRGPCAPLRSLIQVDADCRFVQPVDRDRSLGAKTS